MSEALILIDKPQDWTSFDVVHKIKNVYGRNFKVGHAGTLDPFATGLLMLLLGKATRLSQTFTDFDKRYLATVRLGIATDSLDRTGKVTAEAPVPNVSFSDVEKVLADLRGRWEHIPPMFSAKKIDGKRLYKLARANVEVEREPVAVMLYDLQLRRVALPYLVFEVECSKGTYIRSLAAEVAKRLGTVGHLAELRRLSCGEYGLSDSHMIEQVLGDKEGVFRDGEDRFRKLFRRDFLAHGPKRVTIPANLDSKLDVSCHPQ